VLEKGADGVTQIDPNPVDELQWFLEELESLAPIREEAAGTRVVFRSVTAEEVIEDSLPSEEWIEEERRVEFEGPETVQVSAFQPLGSGPVAAVDCGIARLGETENGLIIALRAAMVIDQDSGSRVTLLRAGPVYLHNQYKARVLYQMGRYLGKEDFFVEVDDTDPGNPRLIGTKRGVADDAHQYGDRFRNWFERLTQRIAVTSIEDGIVLFDGALTLRTRDTPSLYLERLAQLGSDKGNTIIGISKQSMLQVQGRSIRFWLNDVPNRACCRVLTPLMRRERAKRVLGNAYAVRFSALGPTFRMDVKAVEGQSDTEAIGQFYSSALMRGGYPDILVRAHAHCYFTSPDVIQLEALASAKYSLIPQRQVALTGIFAPFGGRFK